MEHLVISHKHRLAAVSRKKLCLLWGEEHGEKIQYLVATFARKKWRRKAIGKMGKKMEGKWGKKSREKIKKKIWKKI